MRNESIPARDEPFTEDELEDLEEGEESESSDLLWESARSIGKKP
jgi:hypothetical protein